MFRVRHRSTSQQASALAISELRLLAKRMLEIATQGADRLKEVDDYQNHTWALRTGTQALLDDGPVITVTLEMDTEYASYVKKLGFSEFDSVSKIVARDIRTGIAFMGRKITRS